VTAKEASAELNTIMREIVREHPKDYDKRTFPREKRRELIR
jgi:hypothetical protein